MVGTPMSKELICTHGVWIGACAACKPIQIPGDQAWRNFSYTFKPGVTKEIYSRKQFRGECGKHGLIQTTKDDLLTNGSPSHPSRKPVDLRPIQKDLEAVYAGSRDKNRVEKKWQEVQAKRQGGTHG